ncbi:MAG: hypothetical protein Q9220_001796 [cf. Caloplaca sp. 1 TL-2023]
MAPGVPENPRALLSPVMENHLAALSLHAPGLTPWGLAMFMQARFKDCPIRSAGDVCKCMRQFFIEGNQVTHGVFQEWAKFHHQKMSASAIDFLEHTLRLVKAWFKDLPVKDLFVRVLHEKHWTVIEQMRQWGLTQQIADETCLSKGVGILFNNRLKHVEDAQYHKQYISTTKAQQWVNKDDFITYMSHVTNDVTAFQLALAVSAIWHSGTAFKDIDVYSTILRLTNSDNWYSGYVNLVGVNGLRNFEATRANAFAKLYDSACRVLELGFQLGDAQYAHLKEDRYNTCYRDKDSLREWQPVDIQAAGKSIVEQMGLTLELKNYEIAETSGLPHVAFLVIVHEENIYLRYAARINEAKTRQEKAQTDAVLAKEEKDRLHHQEKASQQTHKIMHLLRERDRKLSDVQERKDRKGKGREES